jgi:hypothetical protein
MDNHQEKQDSGKIDLLLLDLMQKTGPGPLTTKRRLLAHFTSEKNLARVLSAFARFPLQGEGARKF